jgi:hypothetical protein
MENNTVKDLRKIAKGLKLTGYSKMVKKELISYIKKAKKSPPVSSKKNPKDDCPSGKIRNPLSKRCVSKTGKIGRSILGKEKPSSGKPPPVSSKKNPKDDCPSGKIRNPLSKRCVSKTGKIGRSILGKEKPSGKPPPISSKKNPKDCPSGTIRNPLSKRCVSKNGKIGRSILNKGGSINKTVKNECPYYEIMDPKTNKCFLKSSKMGMRIMDTYYDSGKKGWGGGGYGKGLTPNKNFILPQVDDSTSILNLGFGDRRYPLIMMLYLSWRHGSDCVVIPTDPFRGMTTKDTTHRYSEMTMRWYQREGVTGYWYIPRGFWNEFKKCNKNVRFIIFPMDSQCQNGNAHANYFVYDSKKKEIERFEPNGHFSSKAQQACHSSPEMDEELERLIKLNMGKGFIKKYYSSVDFCPLVGPQSIQSWENDKLITDPKGFCMFWSTWYADVRLSNPDLSRDKVISKAIEILKNRPGSLTKFIRNYTGFFIKIRDELSQSKDPYSIIQKYSKQFSG